MKRYAEKGVNLCDLQTLWESILSQQRSWRLENRVKWKDRKCEQYLNPNRSLDYCCAARYREDSFLSPFFFLLGRDGSDAQRAMQVKRYKKEERANQRASAFLVRIELFERQSAFYYCCAKFETASFKICPLKLPVHSKGKTSVRW